MSYVIQILKVLVKSITLIGCTLPFAMLSRSVCQNSFFTLMNSQFHSHMQQNARSAASLALKHAQIGPDTNPQDELGTSLIVTQLK